MMTMLKFNVDFGTLLIGTKGVRLLRECESKGDPAGANAEEAPGPPAESERPQWKSTDKFNRAVMIQEIRTIW